MTGIITKAIRFKICIFTSISVFPFINNYEYVSPHFLYDTSIRDCHSALLFFVRSGITSGPLPPNPI